MAAPAIPSNLHPAVLEKAGAGWGGDKIAEWLLAEHQVACSSRAVRRLLERTRSERADVAKAVVREKLQRELPADLDALAALRARAETYEREAHEQGDFGAVRGFLAEQRQCIDTTLHYSGAGEPDAAQVAGVVILPTEDEESG